MAIKQGATVQNYLVGNGAGKAAYVADELEGVGSRKEGKLMNNSAIGSSLDDLLKEDGILPEVAAHAVKRGLARSLKDLIAQSGKSLDQLAQEIGFTRQEIEVALDETTKEGSLYLIVAAIYALGGKVSISCQKQ